MRKSFPVVLSVALLASLLGILIPSASDAAGRSLDPATFGMRPSGSFLKQDRLDQYEAELGGQINWYVGMAGRQSPADMKGSVYGQLRHRDAVLPTVADRMNLVMTVPLAFGKQTAKTEQGREIILGKLTETASGAWDDDYRTVAESLVAGGYPDAVIRLGHEFTGGWYPWSAQGNEEAYIAAYRHVHSVLRSVSADFRFEWNSARNTFVEYGPPAYPGDAYVDVVGLDIYYTPWKGDKAFTQELWLKRYYAVLVAHQEFAKAHGKPVAYSEWANGDVDKPEFISAMFNWFVSLPSSGPGSLLYHAYFNVNQRGYDLDNHPKSKDIFIDLFGGHGNTGAPSPAKTLVPVPVDGTVQPVVLPANPVTPTEEPPVNVIDQPTSTQNPSGQFTLFDQQVTHKADSYATFDFAELDNWRSPVDYTTGSTFVRLDFMSKPSDREVQVIACMWRDRFKQEKCLGLGKFTEPGLHYLELKSAERWWKKASWSWDRPIEYVRLMVKDVQTGKLLNNARCGTVCYTGDDLADHTPMAFDAELIITTKGHNFEVPSDWAGCPTQWGGVCAGNGGGPTPPTTTPTTSPTTQTTVNQPTTTVPETTTSLAALPTLDAPAEITVPVRQQVTIDIDTDATTYSWWKVRGPGGLKWVDRKVEDVEVEFLTVGVYHLAIKVNKNGRLSRARVKVNVVDGTPQTTTTTPATPVTTIPGTTPTTGSPVTTSPGPVDGNLPKMSVRTAKATEGSVLVFKVVIDRKVDYNIIATVQTFDVSAVAGEDYQARTLEVMIPAGETKAFIGIPTLSDGVNEGTEEMRLKVMEANGVVLEIPGAKGRILNG